MSIISSTGTPSAAEGGELVIRRAVAADASALARLAALDSSDVPAGDLLVAEVGGEIRAAAPFGGGPPIADPFHPTGDLVSLLELRVRHLGRGPTRHRRLSRRSRLMLRTLRA